MGVEFPDMASSKGIYRVLVADDEPQIASLVKQTLQLDGHFVTVCHDGVEVMKAFRAAKYSAIVLDILMPRKTGVQVLLDLRNDGEDVPVVLMSSFISDDAKNACAGLERVAFLQKPFGISDLRSALESVAGTIKS
jgi:two-component system, OmpR family, copper resistance phosphate regulon response regulator CusR